MCICKCSKIPILTNNRVNSAIFKNATIWHIYTCPFPVRYCDSILFLWDLIPIELYYHLVPIHKVPLLNVELFIIIQEKFDDTTGEIRSRQSKTVRGAKKDIHQFTKH